MGGAAAAWVPLAPGEDAMIEGPLKPAMAQELARMVGDVGSGMAISDLSKVSAMAPLATWFHFLIAVPVRVGSDLHAILLVLGHGERFLTPDDFASLSDAAQLTLELDLAEATGSPQPESASTNVLSPLASAGADVIALVQSAPVVLFALDASGVFLLSEGRGLEGLDLKPRQMIGRSIFEVYSEHRGICGAARQALGGAEVSFATEIGDRAFETLMAPVTDPAGVVTAVFGMSVDATQRAIARQAIIEAKRQAESAHADAEQGRAEAEAARAEAEAAARDQSAFLASMSHEIRTPLTSIIGFADVLAEEVEGEQRSYARLIQRSGRRLLETLNSVLNYARLEAEEVEARFMPTDVAPHMADAVAMLRPMAREKGLELRFIGAPVVVETDPALVHRIATNLISNAIKFTEAGIVTVTVAPRPGGASIRVVDTGRGMSTDFMNVLFSPFMREYDHLDAPAGTGLGLSITKRLVDLLGGTISVDSRPEGGTTFSIFLPDEVRAASGDGRTQPIASGDGSALTPPTMSGPAGERGFR